MSVAKSMIKSLVILGAIVSLNACVVRGHHPDAYGEPHLHGSLHAWYYYPDSQVYFHITDRYYYYYDGFAWVSATVLPRGWVLNPQFRVRINLTGRPYLKHSHHQRKYPGRRPNHGQPPRQEWRDHDRHDRDRHDRDRRDRNRSDADRRNDDRRDSRDNGRRGNGRYDNGRPDNDRREHREDRRHDVQRDERRDHRHDQRHEEHRGDDRHDNGRDNGRDRRGDREHGQGRHESKKDDNNLFVPHTKGERKGERKGEGEGQAKEKSGKEARGKYKNKNGIIERVRGEVNRKNGNKSRNGRSGKARKQDDDDF